MAAELVRVTVRSESIDGPIYMNRDGNRAFKNALEELAFILTGEHPQARNPFVEEVQDDLVIISYSLIDYAKVSEPAKRVYQHFDVSKTGPSGRVLTTVAECFAEAKGKGSTKESGSSRIIFG